VVETRHEPVELVNSDGARAGLDVIQGRPVAAFCGIGNPDAFRRTLADLGVIVSACRTYADHHAYSRDDVDELHRWAHGLGEGAPVVTSQKDLVKLRVTQLGGRPLWALRICLRVEAGREEFEQRLRSLVDCPSTEP